MSISSRTAWAVAAVLAWAIVAVDGLAVTAPVQTTVWDNTGATPSYVMWQLYPPTNPAPLTSYFDIWIRNAVGAMYQPPLNTTLATMVDSATATYFQVTDVQRFLPGPGYQLFLADPTNPDTVYAQSDVFSIGTPLVDASASPSSFSSASTTSTSSGFVTATATATTTQLVNGSPASTTKGELVAATVPGGPAEQGFGLLDGAAAGLSMSLAGVAGAMGVAAALLAV
ncbi:hypothetical protein JCM8097_001086 [Rhodosporidiobolus ruineniae]